MWLMTSDDGRSITVAIDDSGIWLVVLLTAAVVAVLAVNAFCADWPCAPCPVDDATPVAAT